MAGLIRTTFAVQAKTELLRKEIEVLAQTHERTVNCKDAIIEALNHDLDDAEEQFQTAQRGHIQVSTWTSMILSDDHRMFEHGVCILRANSRGLLPPPRLNLSEFILMDRLEGLNDQMPVADLGGHGRR